VRNQPFVIVPVRIAARCNGMTTKAEADGDDAHSMKM
jgi:hypothetical protein